MTLKQWMRQILAMVIYALGYAVAARDTPTLMVLVVAIAITAAVGVLNDE